MTYFDRALVEVALVGALCGLVGVHVVLRRLSFFTVALTHAAFPGAVLAAVLGLNLYLGTGLFGIVVVLAVAWLGRRAHSSTAIGVVLAAGFALGVALASGHDGFTVDLSSYLVGSLVTVSTGDLVTTGAVALTVAVALGALGKELVFGGFDRAGLAAVGLPAGVLDIALLLMIELTVVTALPAVGTILAVALLVAPAATARHWCDRVGPMTALSVALGVTSGVLGLLAARAFAVAGGAAVVLVACGIFAVSQAFAHRVRPVARRWFGRNTPSPPRATVRDTVASSG